MQGYVNLKIVMASNTTSFCGFLKIWYNSWIFTNFKTGSHDFSIYGSADVRIISSISETRQHWSAKLLSVFVAHGR